MGYTYVLNFPFTTLATGSDWMAPRCHNRSHATHACFQIPIIACYKLLYKISMSEQHRERSPPGSLKKFHNVVGSCKAEASS